MALKRVYRLLVILCIILAFPFGSAEASGSTLPEGEVIYSQVSTASFDTWKHTDGTWQDTDHDSTRDIPRYSCSSGASCPGGSEHWEKSIDDTFKLPGSLLSNYTVTGIELIYQDASKDNTIVYKVDGSSTVFNPSKSFEDEYKYIYDNMFSSSFSGAYKNFTDFDKTYLRSVPNNYEIPLTGLDCSSLNSGSIIATRKFDLDPVLGVALNVKDSDIRDQLGLSPLTFSNVAEGWRWHMPLMVKWYGKPKNTPDLKVEIKHLESDVSSGYPTSPNFSAMGTPPFKFNAKVVVTLVDNTNWPPATDTTQIPLWFGYDRFGVRAYDDNTNFITPADLRNTGDTKEFTFEWEADYGDSIYLWAVVNPPNPDEDIPYPIGSLDINAAGPRAIGESGYNNNIADVSLNIGSLPAGTHEYKSFEYIYNRINQPIKVDTDTLYTYKQNKIIMETSTYVNTVKVTFNDNYTVTLTKDGGVSQSDRYIHNASLNVSKQTILPALDTPVFSRTAQEKLVWTFAFDLENYTVYIEPKANEIQFDRLKFEAFDHNGKSAKFGYAEINPLYYYVVVRQTKLFNFRVTDVKDIYWKYVFSDSSGNHILYNSDGSAKFRDLREKESEKTKPPFGITKLPLAGNESSSSRLISKGYAVQCRVDAEGLYRSGDSLVVLPSFWWYNGTGFDEVDLYFDITNDNLYNVPIPVIQNGITGGENYLIKDMDDLIDLSRAEFNRRLDRVLTAFPASERSAKRTEYNNIMFKQEGGKYSLKLDYGLLDVKYNEDRYFENKTSDPRMLLEGTSPWEFRGNGKTGIKLDDDNYFEDYAGYRNTWAFTYSLHPRVKAIPKGANPLDPVAGKPLTGAILVNLKMVTMNSFDRELTSYNYTKFEDTWNTSNGSAPLNFTTPYDTGAGGHGNAFYFNLDWSALDDYSTQQKW